jgi:hypothetical protein
MLFLELTATLALLAFNAFAFLQGKHLLVFNPQLSALQLKVVQDLDYGRCLFCGCKVGESKPAENAIIEMVVESVRQGQVQLGH